jgi:hypothetical protein
MAGYRAIVGDWFGFGFTVMLAGTLVLFFANAIGYLQSDPLTDTESWSIFELISKGAFMSK